VPANRADTSRQWAYAKETDDGRAAVYVTDKPRSGQPFQPGHTRAAAAGRQASGAVPPITLAKLPEPGQEPPDHWPDGERLDYSSTQWVIFRRPKSFFAHHLNADGWPVRNAGTDPWPLWQEAEALEHGRGQWIAEAEGEKCADWLRAGGLVAISQPGHDHKDSAIEARYRRLQAAGVKGIAYLADNDDRGRRKAKRCADAATRVDLPFTVLHAAEVWPGLPEKGSVDDAPGSAIERAQVFGHAAIAAATAASQVDPGPVAAERQQHRRGRLGYADLLPIVEGGYDLSHDTLLDRPAMNGSPLSAEQMKLFGAQLAQDHGISASGKEAEDVLRFIARKNPINPIRNYLASLREREGLRLLTREEIGTAFGLASDDRVSHELLARHLVGCVLRGLKPGYKHDTMLILQGGQGSYKTEAIKALVPRTSWVTTTTEIKETEDWKFLLKVSQCWIFLLDECDKFLRGKDAATLKSVVGATHDTFAKKGHNETSEHPRPSIMFGTTNEQELINDATGVRRWWVCPLGEGCRANPRWITENRDSIWATAFAWASGPNRLSNWLPRGSAIEAAATERAWQASFSTPYASAIHGVLNGLPVGAGAAPGIAQEDLIRGALGLDVVDLMAKNRKAAQDLVNDISRTIAAGGFTTHGGRIRWEKDKRRLGRPNRVAAYLWRVVEEPEPTGADPGPDEPQRLACDPELEQVLKLASFQQGQAGRPGPTVGRRVGPGKLTAPQALAKEWVNRVKKKEKSTHERKEEAVTASLACIGQFPEKVGPPGLLSSDPLCRNGSGRADPQAPGRPGSARPGQEPERQSVQADPVPTLPNGATLPPAEVAARLAHLRQERPDAHAATLALALDPEGTGWPTGREVKLWLKAIDRAGSGVLQSPGQRLVC
jgi:hypothetical protein